MSENEQLSESKMQQILDYTYGKVVNDVPGLKTAQQIADDYLSKPGSLESQVNSLIAWQNTKAGTSGFVTGLGGLITMPVTIPANLASVIYVQMRMIAAIAHMGGYDLKDDRVRTMVYACLTGNAAKELLKDVGIQVGKKLAYSTINKISGATLTKINQAVGFRLVTKFGEKGVINLGKAVPFLGGVIGAGVDRTTTNTIGHVAKKVFILN